jgi:hypothetical protein
MRIKAVDFSTKKPYANLSLALQIRGQNSGFLTVKTDANGFFMLDDSYMGHEITSTVGGGNNPQTAHGQGQWIAATDEATLTVPPTKQKTTTGTGAGVGAGGAGSRK